jgi:hypothetical protein
MPAACSFRTRQRRCASGMSHLHVDVRVRVTYAVGYYRPIFTSVFYEFLAFLPRKARTQMH